MSPVRLTTPSILAACRHLRANDAVLRPVIDQVGPYTLRQERDRFSMLVRSILSQQISVKAARSIRARLEQLVAPDKVTAESLLRFDIDQLRSAGLSPQKARYVLDLAQKSAAGAIQLRAIGRRSDQQVIGELTQVKGIGRWTAQMFLIFALGRPDVLPVDDLGIRVAVRDRYGLGGLPGKQQIEEIARPWRPYATVASWYLWRSLDLQRNNHTAEAGYPA